MANIIAADASDGNSNGGAVYFMPLRGSKAAGEPRTAEPEAAKVRSDGLSLSAEAMKLYYATAAKPKHAAVTAKEPEGAGVYAVSEKERKSTGEDS